MHQFTTSFPLLVSWRIRDCVKPIGTKHLREGHVWLATCFSFGVSMILTFLSAIPETTGLLIVGSVLMLGSLILRRIFVESASAPGAQTPQLEEHSHR